MSGENLEPLAIARNDQVQRMSLKELAAELDALQLRGVHWPYVPVLLRARDELLGMYALRAQMVETTAILEAQARRREWWKKVLRLIGLYKRGGTQ